MYIFFQACHQFLIQHLLLLEPFGLRKFLHSFLSNAVVANRSEKQASGGRVAGSIPWTGRINLGRESERKHLLFPHYHHRGALQCPADQTVVVLRSSQL